LLRGLIHHWRLNVPVVLAAAVATAVLSGALLVGDSVRGSLRALTFERLGRIDDALLAESFFRESLAGELDAAVAAPVVLLRGAAVEPDAGARASDVSVVGIDDRFSQLFDSAPDLSPSEGGMFPPLALNATLAHELGVGVGGKVLLSFPRFSAVPRDTLMGDTDPQELLATLRAEVVEVLPDRGVGRFSLTAFQQSPRNAFVRAADLQRTLDVPGRANAVLIARAEDADPRASLDRSVSLADLGLELRRVGGDHLSVQADRFVLRDGLVDAIREAAASAGGTVVPVRTYLANTLRVDGREVPYSLAAAVEPLPDLPSLSLTLRDGSPAQVSAGGILLDTWAAEDLGASVGDPVEMEYFKVGPREDLTVETVTLTLEGVVRIEGLGADRELTPDYPGIRDVDHMSDWDPPFPVDLDRVRPKDERFWDEFEATPKAFLAPATGARLWANRWGTVTSARVVPPAGEALDVFENAFSAALRQRVSAASSGLTLRPVRSQGLEAAAGATDFGGLFLAFSFFLIFSAALLIALLFRLGVERRAKEIGLLLAVGYRARRVRRRLLGEALVLGAAGAAIGTAGAVGYAAAMMWGLRTLWLDAVGSTRLELHVRPASLALGVAITLAVVALSTLRTVLRAGRVPCPALLSGVFAPPAGRGRRRVAPWISLVSLLAGLGLLGVALATGQQDNPGLAFGIGVSLLVAGLARFAAWCRGPASGEVSRVPGGIVGLAARNSSWNAGRSLQSVALTASASFVIVMVAASRVEFGAEIRQPDSGTGGFSLLAEADVPLYQQLDREDDRFELGFGDEDSARLAGVRVFPFRVLPGDDASCLNLYRPDRPRVLGVPPELIDRGGFRFQKLAPDADPEEPWSILDADLGPGVVPAVADANSAQWILKLGIGDELTLTDERGEPVRLRLAGMLGKGIFQSELLISERNFLEHFPSRSGYGFFLIEAPFEEAGALARVFEHNLDRFGFDAVETRERLASYQAVEHTYLSTFQLLGGLGLLLGTIGLAVVMLRNVIERQGELATLRAFGFRRSRLVRMVMAENAFLLLCGIGIGSLSAILSVLPRLASTHVPWLSLAATLGVVLVVGLLAGVVASRVALATPLLPALKTE